MQYEPSFVRIIHTSESGYMVEVSQPRQRKTYKTLRGARGIVRDLYSAGYPIHFADEAMMRDFGITIGRAASS